MYFVYHGQGVINQTVELLSYVSAMADLGCASGMVEIAIHPFSPSWLSTLFKGAFQESKFLHTLLPFSLLPRLPSLFQDNARQSTRFGMCESALRVCLILPLVI